MKAAIKLSYLTAETDVSGNCPGTFSQEKIKTKGLVKGNLKVGATAESGTFNGSFQEDRVN